MSFEKKNNITLFQVQNGQNFNELNSKKQVPWLWSLNRVQIAHFKSIIDVNNPHKNDTFLWVLIFLWPIERLTGIR